MGLVIRADGARSPRPRPRAGPPGPRVRRGGDDVAVAVELSDVLLRQEELVRAHVRAGPDAALHGSGEHFRGAAGGQAAEVDPAQVCSASARSRASATVSAASGMPGQPEPGADAALVDAALVRRCRSSGRRTRSGRRWWRTPWPGARTRVFFIGRSAWLMTGQPACLSAAISLMCSPASPWVRRPAGCTRALPCRSAVWRRAAPPPGCRSPAGCPAGSTGS